MVSGFLTSPCDHSRIFSGLASEIRIAVNESGSLGFSKKLKMSRMDHSSSAALASARVDSTSSTFRHKDCSSLMSTLKLSGRPASSV